MPLPQNAVLSDPALVGFAAADGVCVLTLDNPENRNALSLAMMEALSGHLKRIAGDESIRAIVLAAEGPVFCAGHDLRELTAHRADADSGQAFFEETFARCGALMALVQAIPQPVIASVEGMATAAGCQLVAASDLAIAGDRARFCTPGVSIGLFCTTPMVALVRNVAPKHAMEMLLTGEPIDAAEAHRIGLVNRVAPNGRAREEAQALAARIAARSALTVSTGKRAFYGGIGLPVAAAYAEAGRIMTANMLAEDAAEGIGAFLEKRAPHWRNR